MMSRWQFSALQLARRLWARAALFSVLAVLTAFVAVWLDPYLPKGLEASIGAESVDAILNIIAASMLTVTTFSLSTMVAAYAAATNNVTPRATKLLMADPTTQNVLSTFIGAFLFSLVGIISLSMGAYGEEGRVVLFSVTILVIFLIVLTLIRWIDHLSRLGLVNETTKTVEQAAAKAMRERQERPYLGGRRLPDPERDTPGSARPVFSHDIGYVRHIDVKLLVEVTRESGADLYLAAVPGTFVHTARPLVRVVGGSADDEDSLRQAFTIGDERSFEQDPLFGLAVMSEIASRALSPGINDAGTAIDVLGRCVRLLALWAEEKDSARTTPFSNIHVPEIAIEECFDHVFTPIGRDGAALVEVQLRIQKALGALAEIGGERFATVAGQHSALALQRGENALALEADRAKVRALARSVGASSGEKNDSDAG